MPVVLLWRIGIDVLVLARCKDTMLRRGRTECFGVLEQFCQSQRRVAVERDRW